jgi:hypothetical protein
MRDQRFIPIWSFRNPTSLPAVIYLIRKFAAAVADGARESATALQIDCASDVLAGGGRPPAE